jgi:cold shock CspA family protein
MASSIPERSYGIVQTYNDQKGYGYIATKSSTRDLFFHISDFMGSGVPAKGDQVGFVPGTNERGPMARSVVRVEELTPQEQALASQAIGKNQPADLPIIMLDWTFIPFDNSSGPVNALAELAARALPETWYYGEAPEDPDKPYPILYNLLVMTFRRLALRRQVLHKVEGHASGRFSIAAFNTGLVNERYEDILAVFTENKSTHRQYWRWAAFCAAGEGEWGRRLIDSFPQLPKPAHFYERPEELVYDIRAGLPVVRWEHALYARIDRYPAAFVRKFAPAGFTVQDPSLMGAAEREAYRKRLAAAIVNDQYAQVGIESAIEEAVRICHRHLMWNYKIAVPMYYSERDRVVLMLPLFLLGGEQPDLALVVERAEDGTGYYAPTVYPLDWAYKCARLVCRPAEDWLQLRRIRQSSPQEE